MSHLERGIYSIDRPKKIEGADSCRKILGNFEQAGLCEQPNKEIIGRLTLLQQHSEFYKDSLEIERGVNNVLEFLGKEYGLSHPQLNFSEKQKTDGRISALLHDIGKSGPATATEKEQETIIRLFAIEEIKEPQSSVGDVVSKNFAAEEKEEILNNLKKCGIYPETTMRKFWDNHALWTRDILEKNPKGIDLRIRHIAASHHFDHGINPYNLSESEIPPEARVIGVLEDYIDVEKKILIAVDQYQAFTMRRDTPHGEAILQIKKNLHIFKNDELMELIFNAIDKLGEEGIIFCDNH